MPSALSQRRGGLLLSLTLGSTWQEMPPTGVVISRGADMLASLGARAEIATPAAPLHESGWEAEMMLGAKSANKATDYPLSKRCGCGNGLGLKPWEPRRPTDSVSVKLMDWYRLLHQGDQQRRVKKVRRICDWVDLRRSGCCLPPAWI
jgi:hypothetical protein